MFMTARSPAAAPRIAVDLELVLAVDSSYSVDSEEFDLQMRGLAQAFRDPAVIASIESTGASGIAVALVQWAGDAQQRMVIGWTAVYDRATSFDFAARIQSTPRALDGATAISGALVFSANLIGTNDYAGRRKVIDVSGDGPSNHGLDTRTVRDDIISSGITINGLPILNEWPRLDSYFHENVIGGHGAFVIPAADYRDYVRAIRLKLIREISIRLAVYCPRPSLVGRNDNRPCQDDMLFRAEVIPKFDYPARFREGIKFVVQRVPPEFR